jgi:hypothetical protein
LSFYGLIQEDYLQLLLHFENIAHLEILTYFLFVQLCLLDMARQQRYRNISKVFVNRDKKEHKCRLTNEIHIRKFSTRWVLLIYRAHQLVYRKLF